MFTRKKEDLLLAATGLVTLAVVGYVDVILEHSGDIGRLWGYLGFASIFVFLELGNVLPGSLIHRVGLVLQVAIALVMYVGAQSSIAPILFVIWAAQIPKAFPSQAWWILLAVLNLILISYQSIYLRSVDGLVTALVFIGFQWFAASSSAVRMSAKRAKEELEDANIKLKGAQSLLAQRGKAQERLRIARDLHDGIGHKLTALSLKIEYAKHAQEKSIGSVLPELKKEVSEILNELRHTVQHIRSHQHVSLPELIDEIQNILPRSVSVDCHGEFNSIDFTLGEQLAYCIQEAVTNALRHGSATRIDVEQVSCSPLVLSIKDNGRGASNWVENGGLKGMNERLAPFGGEACLAPNSDDAGMTLTIKVLEDVKHD